MSATARRAGSACAGGSLSRVRVAVRVRPMTGKEGGGGTTPARCVEEDIDPEGECPPEVRFSHESVRKAFAFDHVFPSAATQEDVYTSSLRPFLSPFLNGFNVTVIAYGQTGAGKTFTVGHHASLGPCASPEAPRSAEKTVASPEDGLIPRFLVDLFEALRSEPSVKTIHVSFLEIYCDEIHDLLSNARAAGGVGHGRTSMGNGKTGATKERPLMIRDDEHRVVVQNLTQIQVETAAKALELMNIGRARQATGSNALNSQSSRSHAIYTVEVSRKFARDIKNAKLTFVDLAGSERLQKTNVQGMCMKESIQINVGLLALSTVINALREDRLQKRRQSMDSNGMNGDTVSFVPYRSSKLTRLLRDALGGNSMSLFIACVSPTTSNSSETLCTLQFADRVSCIENKAQKNVEAVCISGSSSPRRVSSPRSAAASPRNSMRGRSASEIEINRLQEQIIMLKHQLDVVTTEMAEPPVQCTKYEPVVPVPTPLPPIGSKLTPPRVTGLSKSIARREPDPVSSMTSSRKSFIQGSGIEGSRPRSASISEVRNESNAPGDKAAGVRPSMLVLPRIRSSDWSPLRDASVCPMDNSSAKAPPKPPRSSVAIKLFVERLNASASASSAVPSSRIKAEQGGSSDRLPQEEASGCVDQQSVNDCNGTVHEATDGSSSDTTKSPPRDDGDQPHCTKPEETAKPEKSPIQVSQPSIQVFHGRRRSSPPALTIPSVSTKLKSFMESVKPPIRLPARERSDSLSSSSSRSPRSSPSSPSSASTSSVSPMSARRQSLTSTAGAAKSALAAFMEKVKPTWHATSSRANPSTPVWEDEDFKPEQADIDEDASVSSKPEHTSDMRRKPTEEAAEMSSADNGQLGQEGLPPRLSHATPQDPTNGLPVGGGSDGVRESDPAQEQASGPEDQGMSQAQCVEILSGESRADAFQSPAALVEDGVALDAGSPTELLEPYTSTLDDSSDDSSDDQQYEILAATADEEGYSSNAIAHIASDASPSSDSDVKITSPPVDSVETSPNDSFACSQGYVFLANAPLGDETLESQPPYGGPIFPADPQDDRLPTVDQSTQCDGALNDNTRECQQVVAIENTSVAPSDFVIDRRHWRDNVRRHFTGARRQGAVPRRQKAQSARQHPFKWFDLPDSNQEAKDLSDDYGGDNNLADIDGEADSTVQTRRLQQLLGEMRQLVRSETGHCIDHAAGCGQFTGNNAAEDDAANGDAATVPALLDGMMRVLDQRSQCQRRVDSLTRQLRRLTQLLGPSQPPKQPLCPSSASVSVDMVSAMTDEELGRFKLGHQEALVRAALADCEAQILERLQLRLLHFQLAAAAVSSPPPEVFLTGAQLAACQSTRGRELLPLVLSGWVSVSLADVEAEHAWLSL